VMFSKSDSPTTDHAHKTVTHVAVCWPWPSVQPHLTCDNPARLTQYRHCSLVTFVNFLRNIMTNSLYNFTLKITIWICKKYIFICFESSLSCLFAMKSHACYGQGVNYSIEASSSLNTGMETTSGRLMPN